MSEAQPIYQPESSPPPKVVPPCCACGKPGRYLSRSADAMLCEDHGRAELLGGWCARPECQLGIVIAEDCRIEACRDCAALGSGFGDVTGPDHGAAADHLAKILRQVEGLAALQLHGDRVRAIMRNLAGMTFTKGART